LDLDGPEEYVRAAQALLGERVFKSLTSPGNASAEQALTPRIVPIHVTDADHILGQMFRCAELIPQD
jgi:hypothetical protein